MVSIQKLSRLIGKTFSDRMGNQYRLVNLVLNDDKVKSLLFETPQGQRSKRLSDGRVYSDRASPRDIQLKGLKTKRRATRFMFDDELDMDDDDDLDIPYIKPDLSKRRARFGSFETPTLGQNIIDSILDDEGPVDLRGPNSKKSDGIEVHIHIHKR